MTPTSLGFSVTILSAGELFGGVETQILGLCTSFQKMGIDVLPVLFHDRELAARLRKAGLKPAVLSARHRYDPSTTRRLASLVKGQGSRVLHVHGYRAAVTAAVAGPGLGAAVVKTEHGLPEPQESIAGRTKSHLNHALDAWATRHLRAYVCYVTVDIMRRCDAVHAGLHRHLIHNGILPLVREGRQRPAGLEPGPFHVGIVGRVSEVKGIPFALRALASSAVPSHAKLHIIGTGPQQEGLRREMESLGLRDRVHFHGFQRDVLDWLAYLDALLMPSLHEGLPYTLLEAMSLGVPVVASRVGGLAEVLRHDETGLLVDVGDVEALARSIAHLARDSALGHRLGDAAAREQRANYTLARMVDDYLEVYGTAAGSRR